MNSKLTSPKCGELVGDGIDAGMFDLDFDMGVDLTAHAHRIDPGSDLDEIVVEQPRDPVADGALGHLELACQLRIGLAPIDLQQIDQPPIELVELFDPGRRRFGGSSPSGCQPAIERQGLADHVVGGTGGKIERRQPDLAQFPDPAEGNHCLGRSDRLVIGLLPRRDDIGKDPGRDGIDAHADKAPTPERASASVP